MSPKTLRTRLLDRLLGVHHFPEGEPPNPIVLLFAVTDSLKGLIVRTAIVLAMLPWMLFGLAGKHAVLGDMGVVPYIASAALLLLNVVFLSSNAVSRARYRVAWKSSRKLRRGLIMFIGPIIGIVGCYSTVYLRAADEPTACFSAPLTHLDATYVTVGNLGTIGSGALTPASQACRALVLSQTVVDIFIITVVAAALAASLFSRDEPSGKGPTLPPREPEPGSAG